MSEAIHEVSSESQVLIRVQEVTTRFADRLVHDRISLTVRRGEILAIVGGSGSGKSTLLREMVLLQEPTAGAIELLGVPVSGLSHAKVLELRRNIGVLFQYGALFGGLTVLENVAMPLHEHTTLSAQMINEIAAMKIVLAGLSLETTALYPSQLSGGMRKRAALARAIALDPEILFLDEPTSGLDPLSADALDELVLQLRDSLGLTVVMVTHDIDSLWRIADRIVMLGDARVLAEGSVHDLVHSQDTLVQEFFQGPRGRAAQAQV